MIAAGYDAFTGVAVIMIGAGIGVLASTVNPFATGVASDAAGIPISDMTSLRAAGTNIERLAENGVEIFFTQVFRHNFFHADMHPGNIFVNVEDPENPKYAAVDFGIVGTLNPEDKQYLAENFLAFFERDYHRIAKLHLDSGWVPDGTRIDQLETAVRTVCEPIFNKPLGIFVPVDV